MASLEEELRLDEEENQRELAFIREQLPSELKDRYSDDDILYSNDDEVDIDMDVVADVVCKRAKEEGVSSSFDPKEVFFVVQADLDFQEQNL